MKKILIALLVTTGLVGTAMATTVVGWTGQSAYQAVYCYPTGTYWQKQITHFPTYYAAHNSFYAANYGAGTIYCP